MKKYIIIKADTNDGDYVTEKNIISDETLAAIAPMIKAVKDNHKEYLYGDVVNESRGEVEAEEYYTPIVGEECFELFDQLVPHGEYGIHTIESIEVIEVSKETKLL